MNLPGGSVLFHSLVISSRPKLKLESFTGGPCRVGCKENTRQGQLQPADGRGVGARFRHHTGDGFAAGTKQHSAEQERASVQTRARK